MSYNEEVGYDPDIELARQLINEGIVSGDDDDFDLDDVGEVDIVGDVDIVGADDLTDDDLEDLVSGEDDDFDDYDDLDGVEGVDIVGLRRRRGRRRSFLLRNRKKLLNRVSRSRGGRTRLKGAAARVARRKAARRMPKVVTRTPQDVHTHILPFHRDAGNGGLIPAGAEADIIAEPQMPFKPSALVIGDETARDFVITDIKIGTRTMFAAAGAVPASAFKADGILQQLLTMTGQTSQQITVRVRNLSADARAFYGQMVGKGAQ